MRPSAVAANKHVLQHGLHWVAPAAPHCPQPPVLHCSALSASVLLPPLPGIRVPHVPPASTKHLPLDSTDGLALCMRSAVILLVRLPCCSNPAAQDAFLRHTGAGEAAKLCMACSTKPLARPVATLMRHANGACCRQGSNKGFGYLCCAAVACQQRAGERWQVHK